MFANPVSYVREPLHVGDVRIASPQQEQGGMFASRYTYCLTAVAINTVYLQAVLGQIDPHYLHFRSFAMLPHGSPRFIWLTGIASLAH